MINKRIENKTKRNLQKIEPKKLLEPLIVRVCLDTAYFAENIVAKSFLNVWIVPWDQFLIFFLNKVAVSPKNSAWIVTCVREQ